MKGDCLHTQLLAVEPKKVKKELSLVKIRRRGNVPVTVTTLSKQEKVINKTHKMGSVSQQRPENMTSKYHEIFEE